MDNKVGPSKDFDRINTPGKKLYFVDQHFQYFNSVSI